MSIRPFVIAALASVAIAMALGLFLMRAEPGEYHADPSSLIACRISVRCAGGVTRRLATGRDECVFHVGLGHGASDVGIGRVCRPE